MSRFKTFINFNQRQADHTTQILDQVGVSVAVYRQQDADDDAPVGFSVERPSHTFLKNILVYLQPKRGNASQEIVSDAGRGSQVNYLGITEDRDVRVNDQWKVKGITYTVTYIDPSAIGKTEVTLERKI